MSVIVKSFYELDDTKTNESIPISIQDICITVAIFLSTFENLNLFSVFCKKIIYLGIYTKVYS